MASKIQIKRDECGYQEKPPAKQCNTCVDFACDRLLPKWMEERNASGEGVYCERGTLYTVERHGVEKNLRCARHGFAVKKMARCGDWRPK